jgi:hypothetical protein
MTESYYASAHACTFPQFYLALIFYLSLVFFWRILMPQVTGSGGCAAADSVQ